MLLLANETCQTPAYARSIRCAARLSMLAPLRQKREAATEAATLNPWY